MASLTARGRTLLAAGITATVGGVALGQPSFTGVGVLLTALTLLGLVSVRRDHPVSVQRTLEPRCTPTGQPAHVRLALAGTTGTGPLLLEDRVPWALGVRPRFVLPAASGAWETEVDYTVRSDVRGRFPLGPLTVRAVDPFGLAVRTRVLEEESDLIVTPAVLTLPAVGRAGTWTGAGDNRPRAFASGSAEDVTVREYRQGDPLRRVHWRTSARTGELMVRREEQPWQSRATVLLDNRARAHRGHGAASSLEAAVTAAASVAAHLAARGFVVRLVTADGPPSADGWHDGATAADADRMLEELAVVEPASRTTIDTAWLSTGARHGMLVAVLGDVRDDAATLRRLLHHGAPAVALALDVDRWASAGGTPPGESLRAAGWRAVTVRPDTILAVAWRELAAMP
ncbi:DUF58 domain-containing protein [Nocardioides jiangxiensis]|uniref:DUF58 domain-containing protein n=1 Tax=Nocardioides jiangxiensis TaxID=3064524 RepID=A0ABT9B3I9_9ACTN|nr:DUF58 domain-containing protein [Nocardioides sp. WY-20]MDO7869335.1 DUF58 domain-containing protein [Nocardioides sp. WY-20]